jgi:DNA repair protein RecN (Recombination protein N)
VLQSLTIRNVAVIDRLHIEFQKGFSILTGETGAGKSILLDSLSFVLGSRTQPIKLIREGETEASVSISVDPIPVSIENLLKGQGFDCEPPLIIRRIVNREGKSKAFLNDQPISISLLAQLASHFIEIHGQFDHLLNGEQQLQALDQYANLSTADLKDTYHLWKTAKEMLETAQSTFSTKAKRMEELDFLIRELEALAPEEGEEEKLLALKQTEKSTEQIHTILHLINELSQDSLNIEGRLLALQRNVEKLELSSFSHLKQLVENTLISWRDIQEEATHLSSSLEASPISLDQIESRLYNLRQVAHKHRIRTSELPKTLNDLCVERKNLIDTEASIDHLQQNVLTKKAAYQNKAIELYAQRKKAGELLAHDIKKLLEPLKLPQATFLVSFQELPETHWSSKGIHSMEFYISTNPGLSPAPLNKVASGGELSRVMLALKAILKEKSHISTLIFDEIDVGLGGTVAAAMGEQLALLSTNSQILAITHSPQLAAYADCHFRVSKTVSNNKTTTSIQLLTYADRVEEISRMLSGKSITELTRATAQELLKDKVHI